MTAKRVCLAVESEDSGQFARVMDTFSRVMTGLVLEGIDVEMFAGPEIETADVDQGDGRES